MEKNNDRPQYMIASDELKQDIVNVADRIMLVYKTSPECDPEKRQGKETAIQATLLSLAGLFHRLLRGVGDQEQREALRDKILREVPLSLKLHFNSLDIIEAEGKTENKE